MAVAAAGLVADPLPSPLALACRIVAVLLGIELVLVAVRGRVRETGGPPLGPVGPALAAAAAFIVGYAAAGLGASAASQADLTAVGPGAATAAGFALATLALGPVLLGRDLLRIGVGVTLLVTATALVRAGLAGTPGSLEQLAWAALTVAVLGVTAILASAALAIGPSLLIDERSAPDDPVRGSSPDWNAGRAAGADAGPNEGRLSRLPGRVRRPATAERVASGRRSPADPRGAPPADDAEPRQAGASGLGASRQRLSPADDRRDRRVRTRRGRTGRRPARMSPLLFVIVAFAAAVACLATAGRPAMAIPIGIGGLGLASVAAALIEPGAAVHLAGSDLLVGTAYARLFILIASLGGLLTCLVSLATSWPAGWVVRLPAAALAGLGGIALALSAPDPLLALVILLGDHRGDRAGRARRPRFAA